MVEALTDEKPSNFIGSLHCWLPTQPGETLIIQAIKYKPGPIHSVCKMQELFIHWRLNNSPGSKFLSFRQFKLGLECNFNR